MGTSAESLNLQTFKKEVEEAKIIFLNLFYSYVFIYLILCAYVCVQAIDVQITRVQVNFQALVLSYCVQF